MPTLKLFPSGLFLALTVLACTFISGWITDLLKRFNADSSEASNEHFVRFTIRLEG